MIDAGLVGLGRWGRALSEAIRGSGRLRFVREVDPAVAPGTKFEDVLSDPAIKAVVLATPHSLHREQVVAAAGAGKHTHCEKPLALRVEDARAMTEACRKAGVILGVGHNRRFWPAIQELKRIAA